MENKCPTCGAGTKAFIHSLTPGLVSVLIKAIQYVHKTQKNDFHYRDLDLNYSEASNLQKLRLHGLIAHSDKENKKSGRWLITTRGGQFLRGEISVRKQVKTFRNSVTGHSLEEIHIDSLKHKIPYFNQNFAYEYQIPEGIIIPKQLELI